eukprot:450121_1
MGNSETAPAPEELIQKIEKNTLISWNPLVTNQWFESQFTVSQRQSTKDKSKAQLLQSYLNTLCTRFGMDGYGISLMNEAFFTKLSFAVIDELSTDTTSVQTTNDVKSMIRAVFQHHIARVQGEYNKLYPVIQPVLQSEPNMEYMEGIIASNNKNKQYKLLEWYHYQTEHRLNYSSRTQQRFWFLQPSTCKRYYGDIALIPLDTFGTLTDLQNKDHSDPLSRAVMFSEQNESTLLSFNSISCFIWYSLALSASREPLQNQSMPKGAFSKRVNASSGGLHPVECYFILPSKILHGTEDNHWLFCHYPVREHALECLGSFDTCSHDDSNKEEKEQNAIMNTFYVLVSAVEYRETWKYGERGLRYSMLDVGHGLGALSIITNLMGWTWQIASNVSFAELQSKFRLSPADHPRILLKITCSSCDDEYSIDLLSNTWALKKKEYVTDSYEELGASWPILGLVEKHCFDDNAMSTQWKKCNVSLNMEMDYSIAPNYVLRHRRSALEFIVYRAPFAVLKNACFVMKNIDFPFKHLCCFILYVIRVEEIDSGLYLLFPKHAQKYENIYKKEHGKGKAIVGDELRLYQVEAIPEQMMAKMSKYMACEQSLCSNACFTIDFCVDLDVAVQNGYNYSASHWECGFIGQLLYNHMESMALAACAIGCYLDDLASQNVGFLPHKIHKKEEKSQSISPSDLKRFEDWNHPFKNIRSLCHFACGKPSQDLRYPYYAWDYDLFDSQQLPFHRSDRQ